MDTDKIKLHKSKFYGAVLQDPKVYQLSTTELDENNKPKGEEKVVLRSDFAKFIADKVVIEPEETDDVLVEVVAPVLKAGKMKWKGVFDGKPITFNMIDSDFKSSVLSGEVSFTSGTSIRCGIQFEKAMGDDGEIKITHQYL
ncbi:MAG: hypothetical protein IPL86_15060 [Flavobacteriales bacterium]|nr:hypothetical protein [Flavobacteriales bacterium]